DVSNAVIACVYEAFVCGAVAVIVSAVADLEFDATNGAAVGVTVDCTVAVIVEAIAHLNGWEYEVLAGSPKLASWITAPSTGGAHADPECFDGSWVTGLFAGVTGAAFVDCSVTVVVESVTTDLTLGVDLVDTDATERADLFVNCTITVVVEPVADLDGNSIAAFTAGVAGTFIDQSVAVVVEIIADLHRRGDLAPTSAPVPFDTVETSAHTESDTERLRSAAVAWLIEPSATGAALSHAIDGAVAVVVQAIIADL
ncbi:MAG: hypothetical protein ACJAYU_004532, partial [Bradymonadia bacterium]